MVLKKLCIGLVLFVVCTYAEDDCTAQLGLECVIEKSKGEFYTVGVDDCENYSDKCCVSSSGDETKCYAKMKAESTKRSGKPTLNSGKKVLEEAMNIVKRAKTEARFLNINPVGFPGCLPPVEFPSNCNPTIHEPYVLEPPVNIPYCVRIPCSMENNNILDKDQRLCGTQPGCYFDMELFEYREAFGSSVLPGVPVCHLAIRSAAFHEKAQNVVNKYGEWNPYFTNCLLREHHEDILTGPKGCDLIQILEAFHIKPKLAGWQTITSRKCALIDGCWRPGHGCFYPVDVSNVMVKSGQRSSIFNKNEIVHGRPKCQHFDNSSPLNILKSYHQCLSSGCTVDSSVTTLYYSHLFSIGEGLSVKSHWNFWEEVERGHIGAHNVEDRIFDLGYNPKNTVKSIEAPTKSNPFDLPAVQANPFSNIFGNPAVSQFPRRVRSLSNPFFTQENKACGLAFRNYDARPCSPPKIVLPRLNPYCPYKPFFVPRFAPLKGSFEGCCDINLCYLPKSEISRMHSGSSHYYSEWSLFTPCSVSCGVGTKQRSRKCIGHEKSRCTEPLTQVRSCRRQECTSWGQWGSYSPCPKTCFPGGLQTRKRECRPLGGTCLGESEEVKTCNIKSCFPDNSKRGVWSSWQKQSCTYNRFEGMCVESKTRYCTYMGVRGGKCVGSSVRNERYRCSGCF